jgi:Regulatory subunit of type II PKA R-subunit
VHRDLPKILKDYSKEVIRSGPENVIQFSREYFESILKAQGYFETGPKKPKQIIEANEGQFVWREGTAKVTDHYKLMDNISETKKVRAAVHKVTGVERSILQKPFKVGTPEREALKTRIIEHSARFDHRSIVKLIEVFEDE